MARIAAASIAVTATNQTASAFSSIDRSLSGLQTGFTNLEQNTSGRLENIKNKLIGVGLAFGALSGLGKMFDKFTSLVDAGDAMSTLSDKTGIAVEDLSRLQYAAKNASVDITAATGATTKFAINLSDANKGSDKAVANLKAVGISLKDVQSYYNGTKTLTDLLEKSGEYTKTFSTGADKIKAYWGAFGKGSESIIAVNENMKKTNEEAEKLGIIMSQDFASNANSLNSNIDKLKTSGIKDIFEEALPALNKLSQGFLDNKLATNKARLGQEELVKGQAEWIVFVGNDLLPAIDSIIDAYNVLKNVGTILYESTKIVLRNMADAWEVGSSNIKRSLTTIFSVIGSLTKANEGLGELKIGDSAGRDKVYSKAKSEINEAIIKQGQQAVEDNKKIAENGKRNSEQNIESLRKLNEALTKGTGEGSKLAKTYREANGGNLADAIAKRKEDLAKGKFSPTNGNGADVDGGAGAKAAGKVAKATYDAQLKELEFKLSQEQKLYARADEEAKLYYSNNKISEDKYFQDKKNNLEKSIRDTAALYDEELRIIRDFASKASPEEKVKAEAKAREIEVKKNDLLAQSKIKLLALGFEEDKAKDSYKKTADALYTSLLEGEGKYIEAIKIRLELENKDLKEKAAANGDNKLAKAIQETEQKKIAAASLTEYQKKYTNATELASIKEEELGLLKSNNQLGEISYLVALGNSRQAQMVAMKEQIDLMNQIDKASMTEEQRIQLAKLGLEYKKLAASMNPLKDQFDDIFSNSFSSFREDILSGNKTIGESFKGLFKSIEKGITDLVAKELSQKLMQSLIPSGKDGSGGITGLLASVFGGASSGGSSGGAGAGGFLSMIGGFLTGTRAVGGPVAPGGRYLVGENGPETLIMGNGGGNILNSSDTKRNMGGQNNYNVNFQVNAKDAASFNSSKDQIMGDLQMAMNRASKRNN